MFAISKKNFPPPITRNNFNIGNIRPVQWRIQDFLGGMGTNSKEEHEKLLFVQFSPKTAWKWKELNRGGGRSWHLLGSANAVANPKTIIPSDGQEFQVGDDLIENKYLNGSKERNFWVNV